MRAKLTALAATVSAGLLLSFLGSIPPTVAQSCPATQSSPQFLVAGSVFGRIAAQWNAYFAAKVDTNNGTLCNPTIVGTLALSSSIIINSLGYTPLATNGSNATNPFYIDTATGFGVPRDRAPISQVEISGDGAALSVDHPVQAPTSQSGIKLRLNGSDGNLHEYGYISSAITSNTWPIIDGVTLLYATKSGSRLEYLRVGNGGTCIAEGGTFCGLNGPPLNGLVTQGGVRTPAIAIASLPTCNAGAEGLSVPVNNSNTATFNATVAAGGSNHIVAYCNATNWVVR